MLANVLTTITNTTRVATVATSSIVNPRVTIEHVATMIIEEKGEMKEYLTQMKREAIIETHTYTNIVTKDLKEKLNNRFD